MSEKTRDVLGILQHLGVYIEPDTGRPYRAAYDGDLVDAERDILAWHRARMEELRERCAKIADEQINEWHEHLIADLVRAVPIEEEK